MGLNFYLACYDCQVFIDLHKWPQSWKQGKHLAKHGRNSTLYPEYENYQLIDISTDDIRAASQLSQPQQDYITRLKLILNDFLPHHNDHQLFLICDRGEFPWDVSEPYFAKWKEFLTPVFDFSPYLPRNLVEDIGIQSLEEAERYLGEHYSWMPEDYIAMIKAATIQILEKNEA